MPLWAVYQMLPLARVAYGEVDRGDRFCVAEGLQGVRDIEAERRVATAMASDGMPVDDALAREVDCSEVQEIAFARALEHRDAAAIPDGLVGKQLVAYSGER